MYYNIKYAMQMFEQVSYSDTFIKYTLVMGLADNEVREEKSCSLSRGEFGLDEGSDLHRS